MSDYTEIAARALYYRDYAEANIPAPTSWEDCTDKWIWRAAVSA